MTMVIARFVSDLGDQAVLLPVAILTAAILGWARWRRGFAAWCGAIGGTLGLMLLLKLVSIGCAPCWQSTGLKSPSGHTAAAAAIYGSLVSLAVRRLVHTIQWTLGGAVAIAVLFGSTRLLLSVHTVPDVLVGTVVGVAGAIGFVLLAGPPPPALRPTWIFAGSLITALTLQGYHLPAEFVIEDIWHRLRLKGGCAGASLPCQCNEIAAGSGDNRKQVRPDPD